MTIQELIDKLTELKGIHGPDVEVQYNSPEDFDIVDDVSYENWTKPKPIVLIS